MTQECQALWARSQLTLKHENAAAPGWVPPLLPAPVHSQVLPNGHEKAGGSMLPQAPLCPRGRRPLQLLIPSL